MHFTHIIHLVFSFRYLVAGVDFQTLSFNFRLGHSTVHEIVNSTSKIIWKNLSKIVMPQPTTESLQKGAQDFENIWNFPNCVGAIDGKHMTIQAPKRSGSLYFNYKKTYSIVLLAIVDANYKFIAVDVGSYGKNSDAGIFTSSAMGKSLDNKTFGMPADTIINENSGTIVPHVIVGDEAFPLKTYLMRPYSGRNLPEEKRIFNYRLSRARRISENAFGILCQKFRLFFNKMQVSPKNADSIILSALCLHNFLRNDNIHMSTLDSEKNQNETPILVELPHVSGRLSNDAIKVRDIFKDYFCSSNGSVPLQMDCVNGGIVGSN